MENPTLEMIFFVLDHMPTDELRNELAGNDERWVKGFGLHNYGSEAAAKEALLGLDSRKKIVAYIEAREKSDASRMN